MAERSIFFNSAPDDPRKYQASDFAKYFGDVLSTGLLHTDNTPALEVKCDGGNLQTYVTAGKALMEGYGYENDSDLYLDHALPETTADRIDRIVLRLDKRNQSRFIRLFVKQGESNNNPVPPELQRDNLIWELSLAQIRVRANTSSLDPSDLVDERLNEDLCGLVYSLISIPTSQFQDQWDTWFNENTANFSREFNEWFDGLQDTGFASSSEFNEHQEKKASQTEDGHMTSTDKTKLDGIQVGAQVNTVTSVAGKTGAVTLAGTDIPAGTTSARGTVQLNNTVTSTSTTQAATANAVKTANDNANGRVSRSGDDMTARLGIHSYTEKLDSYTNTNITINPTARAVVRLTYTSSNARTIGFNTSPSHYFADTATSMTVIVNQHSSPAPVTFDSHIKWKDGEIPDLSGASKTYVLAFVTYDQGVSWLGCLAGEF